MLVVLNMLMGLEGDNAVFLGPIETVCWFNKVLDACASSTSLFGEDVTDINICLAMQATQDSKLRISFAQSWAAL